MLNSVDFLLFSFLCPILAVLFAFLLAVAVEMIGELRQRQFYRPGHSLDDLNTIKWEMYLESFADEDEGSLFRERKLS